MGASVQISRRLGAIADLVTQGNRLVDVGCDHGYLPVYLKLEEQDSKCDRNRCCRGTIVPGTGAY